MAASRHFGFRWVRRYRVFFLLASSVFFVQIYLAFRFLKSNPESGGGKDIRSSGKAEVVELDGYLRVDRLPVRKQKENYLPDDEDSPSNSNQVNPGNGIYRNNKLPPDKGDGFRISAGERLHQTSSKENLQSQMAQLSKDFNKTSLRVEELDFVPMCEVTVSDAISAIHRAKTQRCKQELVNVTCLMQQQKLYPKFLPHYCPAEGHVMGKSLGCFQDQKNFRLLTGYFANLKTNNSPQQCINLCLQSGFPYAGLQYSTECFCGNEKPPVTARLPDSSCDMKCPSFPHLNCGGYFTIHVYETGIAKFAPELPLSVPYTKEASARVAFILSLNGRAVRQVRRLVKALYHVEHYFYIHVDARQDYLFRELMILERQYSNIKLASFRLATIWGGASLLQMLLHCMKDLLAQKDWNWDFVINLSESDFPIKTNDDLVTFLTANKGRNFVKSHGREAQRFIQKQGLDKTFFECEAHMWRIGERRLPWGVQLDGGSDWIALSRSFVEYVAGDEEDELVRGLSVVFQYTLLPAESFFHTVLRNSRFCHTYVDNNLHVTNWKRRLGCKCQYKHVVDWCGCSPNDFRPEDWPRLQGTEGRQLYFARKFEPIINQAIVDQVEEWLYGAYPIDVPTLHSYWQNMYHYADLSPQPDDALVSIATSLSRLNMKLLGDMAKQCGYQPLRVREITSYHHNDAYKGTLVLYEAFSKSIGKTVQLEVWVKPVYRFKIMKTFGAIGRLKTLLVSSDYDQKEQLLRNNFQTLGPFSEPSLFHQWGPGDSFNATFLWLDPSDTVAGVFEATVKDGTFVHFMKPVFKQPLRPGLWSVKLVYNGTVAAQTDFLITPLQFVSGVEISEQQTAFLHNGPGQPYSSQDVGEYEKLIDGAERSALLRRALLNSRRFGPDLWEWIDSLTGRFYTIEDTCLVMDRQEGRLSEDTCSTLNLDDCQKTVWSSRAVDLKSEIRGVNKSTGRLIRQASPERASQKFQD